MLMTNLSQTNLCCPQRGENSRKGGRVTPAKCAHPSCLISRVQSSYWQEARVVRHGVWAITRTQTLCLTAKA
jgi:hypothetical protein